MASENSQGSVADTLKVFVASLVLLIVLAASMEDQTKYAWAEHELGLFRGLSLTSWQAYVDNFVSEHYWSPLNDTEDRSSVVSDFLRPNRNTAAIASVERDEIEQRERSIEQITTVLRMHDIEPRVEALRAGSMFGWTGDAPNVSGALRDYRIGNAGHLWLFKPAFDDLANWVDHALASGMNGRGTLISLRCAPPSAEQIAFVKSYVLGRLGYNPDPGRIAIYMDPGLVGPSPLISSRCTLTVDYAGQAQLGVYSEDLKGHIVAPYGPDPKAWLKFTAEERFKAIPDTEPDFRLNRLQEGYMSPFIGWNGDFLPYARAVWPEISELSIDDAINYLSHKRAQKRDDVEIFGFKIPFDLVVTSSPILIVLLCLNLNFSLWRTTPQHVDADSLLLRYGDRFPRLRYLLCLALVIGLPIYALLFVGYALLTQGTETDSLPTLVAALTESASEIDLPEAWEPIRVQAESVVGTALWTLLLTTTALTIVIVVGRRTARHLRALRTDNSDAVLTR